MANCRNNHLWSCSDKQFIDFYGTSFITDEIGSVVAKASNSEEDIISYTFDFDMIKVKRASWGLFRDRRPNLYNFLLTLDGSQQK